MTIASQESGQLLPAVCSPVPGPRSLEMGRRLSQCENQGITFLSESFPVFWERAFGANVWDADGNRFVDLTAAFGVASLGHSNSELVRVAKEQSERLFHGMGDVHPPIAKLEFLEALNERLPGDLGGGILGQNGADAVEAALKAAYLHTERPGILVFNSGYHGLTGLALEATQFEAFREPFSPYLGNHVHSFPYPFNGGGDIQGLLTKVADCIATHPIGAILVEPIQARGGIILPPDEFLPGLRNLADGKNCVLIFDEIYTGMGRTGYRFACEHYGVVPDLMCLGKAITGGFPLSVCVGTEAVMRSWPVSTGEAIHTSTFLGHPVGCAVARRSLDLHDELDSPRLARETGEWCFERLQNALAPFSIVQEVRGIGLMLGIQFTQREEGEMPFAVEVMQKMLRRGFILLPSGKGSRVLSLTPPLVITREQLDDCIRHLVEVVSPMARAAEDSP